ncbi:MAG: DUF2334 domain-containing protein [Allosphingosinicella sp.]
MLSEIAPPGKSAAICFSIDDVHPGRSSDPYEGGGDLAEGALGHVLRLMDRHPGLRTTLFTTPDWRELQPMPTKAVRHIPWLRDRMFLAPVRPKGAMSLERHPEFVAFLGSEPRFEVALHGLHHIHRGPRIPVEFQDESREECVRILRTSMDIFRRAGLAFAPGMTPPGWAAPPPLLEAMAEVGLDFVASARDILTPIAPGAKTAMSGLQGVDLIQPQPILDGRLIHVPANFQATNTVERAVEILEAGGLLSVKGHIVKDCYGHIALDGIDALYCNYLDTLFSLLEDRFGDSIWWTSMGEIAARAKARLGARAEGIAA